MEEPEFRTVEEESSDLLLFMLNQIRSERNHYQNQYYKSMDEKLALSRKHTTTLVVTWMGLFAVIAMMTIWINCLRYRGEESGQCYPNGTCNAGLVCSKDNTCDL